MSELEYRDPEHEGNSSKYLTGKICIERKCQNIAGTRWGKFWCFHCNVKRMDKINEAFSEMLTHLKHQ